MYNLNIYPIHLYDGKLEKILPGLIALAPPRKCARGRESDQLIIQIHLIGQTSITPQALQEWLSKKGDLFYKVPGTVTNAMRMVAESINSELLDRNLKKAGDGSQVNGTLSLVVIKKNISYHLIIGQSHIFILKDPEPIEYVDGENHPRGLGVNQTITCRFSQCELTEKDSILIAPVPSRTWNVELLRGSNHLSNDALSRRLFNQAPANLRGALIRLSPGTGQVSFQPFNYPGGTQQTDGLVEVSKSSEPSEREHVLEENNAPQEEPTPVTSEIIKGDEIEPEIPALQPVTQSHVEAIASEIDLPQRRVLVQDKPVIAARKEPNQKASKEEIKAQVGGYVKAVDSFQSRLKVWMAGFLGKVLPGTRDEGLKIPRSVLLIIAIAIPILVVSVASSVYIRKGKSQQFELFYLQGQQFALQAEGLKHDSPSRLASLQQSLYFLEKAEEYEKTDDSVRLRAQIQKELDALQGIVRLNLVGLTDVSISGEAKISQMVATNTDLYLLDEVSGRVLRYFLSGSGYTKDLEFDCGPNPENPLNTIGRLVDIVPLPAGNSFGATLFGIDMVGNIEYCIPGDSGTMTKLIPPDAGWRGIRSISLFQNSLHVLDPEGNAVYRYDGSGTIFEEQPTFYFDDTVPPLTGAIEIEVNGDELYILRSNGEMVECTYSHMKDYKLTECIDPAPYGDMRTGQSSQVVSFPQAEFIQMRMTPAPDSSLYLLDSSGRQLFHLSLQRNLQKILNPGFEDKDSIPQSAISAIAVSPGKIVFVAYGNLLYYSPLP